MPRVKIPSDLKKAIINLSHKEKDKLIFRMLPGKPALAEELAYKLLEGGETMLERRNDLQQALEKGINYAANSFYSPGYLLLDLRSFSGEINKHVKTTKDKYGEISLNFFMLNKTMALLGDKLKYFPPHKSRTFNNYVVKRAIKLLKLLDALHEDYQLDFAAARKELTAHIRAQENMLRVVSQEGLSLQNLSGQ